MKWSTKPIYDRLKHIGGFIAMTGPLSETIRSIRGHYDAWGTAPEGRLLFLTGETRVGKTTAIDEFITDLHTEIKKEVGKVAGYEMSELGTLTATMAIEYRRPSGFCRPVLKILVGTNPTFDALLADLYFLLSHKRFTVSSKTVERMHLLKTNLREQEVRMIILDDAQHICDSTRNKKYDAADLLKVILKETRVQIICAGLPYATEMLDANTQADSMTWERCQVMPFMLDASPRSDLMKFLSTVNAELPFDRPSTLDEPDVAIRVGLFSQGRVGRVMLLLHSATDYAVRKGHKSITASVLADTLRDKFQISDQNNVFSMNKDDLNGYEQIQHTRRQERIRAAENRRSRDAGHSRKRKAFGTRAQ